MTYGHLQADCLYTGISSGPNARYRVWEAFTFLLSVWTYKWNMTMALFSQSIKTGLRLYISVKLGTHKAYPCPRAGATGRGHG